MVDTFLQLSGVDDGDYCVDKTIKYVPSWDTSNVGTAVPHFHRIQIPFTVGSTSDKLVRNNILSLS